jgi:hypothetical protein
MARLHTGVADAGAIVKMCANAGFFALSGFGIRFATRGQDPK